MTLRRAAALALVALGLTACPTSFLRFDDDAHEDAGADGGEDAGGPAPVSTVWCLEDGGCALGLLHCDPATHRCAECAEDGHCANPRARCDPATDRCVECLSAADCGGSGSCIAGPSRCVRNCTLLTQCPAGTLECESTGGYCSYCEFDGDCAGSTVGHRCDENYGRCVECVTAADCSAPKPLCDRTLGRCVGCLSSAGCGAGLACHPTLRECVAP